MMLPLQAYALGLGVGLVAASSALLTLGPKAKQVAVAYTILGAGLILVAVLG